MLITGSRAMPPIRPAISEAFVTSLILAYSSESTEMLLAHSSTLKSLLEIFLSIS